MSVSYRPTPEQLAAARYRAQRGGRIAYDALDFGVAAKNTYGADGWKGVHNGSVAVEKYKKLKTDAGFKTGTWEEGAFGVAADAANVSGMVISAIALPKMAQQTVTSFKELSAAIHDPTATTDTRLNKLEATARAGAGTIFSAQGAVVGAKATVGILARNRGMAEVASKVSESKITRFIGSPLGKAFNVLLPIADGAVFVGEVIATRRTFNDPNATTSAKVREVLNLGLASMKVAFWLLPGVQVLKEAYTLANFTQLALSLWDFRTTMLPFFGKVAKTTAWGVTHPAEALADVTKATVSGISTAAHAVVGAAGWLFTKATHPSQTMQSMKTESTTWWNAYLVARGRQLVSYVWPGNNTPANNPAGVPQAPVQVAYAPPAASPIAPVPGAPAPVGVAGAGVPVPAAPPPPPPVPAAPPPAPAAPPPPAAPAPMVASVPALPADPNQAFQQAMAQIGQMGQA